MITEPVDLVCAGDCCGRHQPHGGGRCGDRALGTAETHLRCTCETSIPVMRPLASLDWESAFEVAARDSKLADGNPTRSDVVHIEYIVRIDGDYAETTLVGVFRLRDGTWLYVTAWCDTTGWGCQDGGTFVIAATRDMLWWGACTAEDRSRITAAGQRTKEDTEAELVELDRRLERGAGDDVVRRCGELRGIETESKS